MRSSKGPCAGRGVVAAAALLQSEQCHTDGRRVQQGHARQAVAARAGMGYCLRPRGRPPKLA
jgi:hypothetical protein